MGIVPRRTFRQNCPAVYRLFIGTESGIRKDTGEYGSENVCSDRRRFLYAAYENI